MKFNISVRKSTALFVSSILMPCAESQVPRRVPETIPEIQILEFKRPLDGGVAGVKGWQNVQLVPSTTIPGALTDKLESAILRAALENVEVRRLLGQRFAHISTDEVEVGKDGTRSPSDPLLTRLTFFSHTKNVAVVAQMRGLTVENVRRIERYQPPEGITEIEEAIGMAKSDYRLKGKVDGLIAGALMFEVPQGQRGYGHRVLEVIFSQDEEGIASYHALVDFTVRRVLAAGPAASHWE